MDQRCWERPLWFGRCQADSHPIRRPQTGNFLKVISYTLQITWLNLQSNLSEWVTVQYRCSRLCWVNAKLLQYRKNLQCWSVLEQNMRVWPHTFIHSITVLYCRPVKYEHLINKYVQEFKELPKQATFMPEWHHEGHLNILFGLDQTVKLSFSFWCGRGP